MKYIDYYYLIEERDLVILYYKCLVNASLLKSNSRYLVSVNVSKVVAKCFYENDREFYLIATSLLFNMTYVFSFGEISMSELFNSYTEKILNDIYATSLRNDYQEILGEIIDILLSLI